jgi:crotonobetaine/carnitine-CoA ligase
VEWDLGTEILPQRLEIWAERKGDQPFFYYGEEDQTLTFKQFNSLANQLANSLIALGIQKGDTVCLLLRNPFITAISMYGIWKCGAIFAPVNFNYAARQIAFQIGDTKPKCLISDVSMIPVLNEIKDGLEGKSVILYKPSPGQHDYSEEHANRQAELKTIDFDSLLTGNDQNPGIELNIWDQANIIYTSGTTGLPKGVVQPYRYMVNYNLNRRLVTTSEDVLYTDLPMYHVAAAYQDLGTAVWSGCKIAVWDKFSPNEFWKRIHKCGASQIQLLDVVMQWLLNNPESPDDKRNSLKWVHTNPLLPSVHRRLAERFGFDFIVTGYGSTESGNPLAGYIDEELEEGTPPDLWKGMPKEEMLRRSREYGLPTISAVKDSELIKKGWLGKPSAYHEIKIVDEKGMEVPPGTVGEMLIRPKKEHWMIKEYHGRPEATVKAFQDLWYHTGDAVYQSEEGHYYFVDRIGLVIRRRGENISPLQIEEAANALSGVLMSAAFPVPAEEGGENEIALVVVPKEGTAFDEEQFKEDLKSQLPRFMYPKYISFKSEIPRTATNKIEKYKLRNEIINELNLKS